MPGAGNNTAYEDVQHTLALVRAEKADALSMATSAAAAKTEVLGRLAAAEGARKAVQRQLTVLQEVGPYLAPLSAPEVILRCHFQCF